MPRAVASPSSTCSSSPVRKTSRRARPSSKRRIVEEAPGPAYSVLLSLRERYLAAVPRVVIRTVEHASVAQGLCAVAAEPHADLVLLSGRDRWGAAQVPEKLLRLSLCRVLVLPAALPTRSAH